MRDPVHWRGPGTWLTLPMLYWIVGVVAAMSSVVGVRVAYRRWRRRRIEARRIIEKPNSFYSSILVKNQVDRTRWGRIDLSRVHPVNREEVERLLSLADTLGVESLSPRERLFLETLTELSFG